MIFMVLRFHCYIVIQKMTNNVTIKTMKQLNYEPQIK